MTTPWMLYPQQSAQKPLPCSFPHQRSWCPSLGPHSMLHRPVLRQMWQTAVSSIHPPRGFWAPHWSLAVCQLLIKMQDIHHFVWSLQQTIDTHHCHFQDGQTQALQGIRKLCFSRKLLRSAHTLLGYFKSFTAFTDFSLSLSLSYFITVNCM